MPRGDQVARLYTLVLALARTKHGLTASALAHRHSIPLRTVYRDLHALETAGFPVTNSDGARWKLIDGWQGQVPFPLPLGQLLALHVARDLTKPLRGTPFAREFDALFDRLTGPVPCGASGQGELFPRFCGILATRSQLAIDYTQHAALLVPGGDRFWEAATAGETRNHRRGSDPRKPSASRGFASFPGCHRSLDACFPPGNAPDKLPLDTAHRRNPAGESQRPRAAVQWREASPSLRSFRTHIMQ